MMRRRMRVPDSQITPKVLFVTSNRIGDCVISSGVIREIERQLPGAAITSSTSAARRSAI